MNSEAEQLLLRRQAEDAGLSLAERRARALGRLKLKTVIKESHCSPVHSLAFNAVDEECANLFATVGKDQATVYNDQHMGDYISVVVHFTNVATEHSQGGELGACAWLSAGQWTKHPQGDACLAVSGEDCNVSVISLVESRVSFLLTGHRKPVVDLASCSGRPGLLASLAADGELRLWDVPAESCLACAATDATALAMHPDGSCLVTGGRKGGLQRWDLGPAAAALRSPQRSKKQRLPAQPTSQLQKQALQPSGGQAHLEAVDCLAFLSPSRLASKSADGRCIVTDLPSRTQAATWKVPQCSPAGGLRARARFGATADGAVLCVGNSRGEVFVHDTATGERLAHVAAIKVSAPVRACGLSHDCRHLLACMGNGFIFRFEAAAPEAGSAAEPAEPPADA